MLNSIKNCFNTEDFRKLAKRKLPFPVFHYIDGAADDEVTLRRNTQAFEEVDLIPNVLKGVENIDISTELMGKKISAPLPEDDPMINKLKGGESSEFKPIHTSAT